MRTDHINCSVPKWNISTHLEGQKINLLREGQVGGWGEGNVTWPWGPNMGFFLNEPSLMQIRLFKTKPMFWNVHNISKVHVSKPLVGTVKLYFFFKQVTWNGQNSCPTETDPFALFSILSSFFSHDFFLLSIFLLLKYFKVRLVLFLICHMTHHFGFRYFLGYIFKIILGPLVLAPLESMRSPHKPPFSISWTILSHGFKN